jgi:hypothetical protein
MPIPLPRSTPPLLALLVALLTSGARGAARPHAPAPADATLDVVATDFAFTAPDTVRAGRTRVRLTSHGREMHLLEIVRIEGAHTAEEVAALVTARRPLPTWATFVGGPLPRLATAPDAAADELAVTIELTPGRYALLCPIPSPDDHRPHTAKGMVRTLVVSPARRATRAAPATARVASSRVVPPRALPSRVVLDDYGFVLEPAWRAGRQRLQVENRAAQPHELVVFRLDEGKRVADVVRWAGSLTGPPPGTLVGGTTALGRGSIVTLTLTLAPGRYGLLCFLPDAADGRSHVQHGMTREFTVE